MKLNHFVRTFFNFQLITKRRAPVDCKVVFWHAEVQVGEPAAFQLSITAPPDVLISELPFSTLTVTFSDDCAPLTLQHVEDETTSAFISVGAITKEARTANANLRWQRGSSLVISGTMVSDLPTTLKVTFFYFGYSNRT